MTEITLDCQGLACPGPVLRCKQRVDAEHPERITVVVDNQPAQENVTRLLTSLGYEVTSTKGEAERILVTGARRRAASAPATARDERQACEVMAEEDLARLTAKVVALITAETIGRGSDELGAKLMLNFLSTLPELGEGLWRIILVNGGVKLATRDSLMVEALQGLAASGVQILVCGTCLDYFGLLDQKVVGETTNMLDVVTSLALATKIIEL